jgi:hypothetical protein
VTAPVRPAAAKAKPASAGVPKWLYVIAVLPVGIPILTLGGALWGAIGCGLAGANVKIAQNQNMSIGARVGIMLGLTVLGYAILFALGMAVLVLGRK